MELRLFDPDNKKTEVFLKYSNYEKIHREHLVAGLQCLAPRLWKRLLDPDQECSLYLVGAKNGLLEIPFLKATIKQRGSMKELYLTCQGTSAAMRKEFHQRALDGGLSNLVAEYQVVHFEEPLYIAPLVHIAMAPYEWLDIVAWKNTPREHNSLLKFRNSLHHGGAGMMVFPYQAGDRFLLLQILKSFSSSSVTAGEEVVEELCYLQVRHQAYIVETIVNMECCFQRERFRPDQEGEKLLSYLLQVEWQSLPPLAMKKIGEKIAELRAHYEKPKMILQNLYLWIFPGTPHERDLEKEKIIFEEI